VIRAALVHSDNLHNLNYRDLMADGRAIIQVKLETTQPIELNDFIAAFASIGSEYARFIKREHADLSDDAKIFVSQVRQGSIIAELIPIVMPILQAADCALIVDQFVERVGGIVRAYQTPNARPDAYSKSEIKGVMEGIAAIANDPNGRADISSILIEGGETKIRAAITFTTQEARTAIGNMREHIRMIEHHEDLTKTMVLMTFFQSNLKDAELQSRSGEQVVIQSIDPRPRPLVYASEMAKARIKHEVSESEGNIYKKGFYVDVVVDMAGDRIAAYKITNFHEVIDLPS
jgi:hypothetical protein